MEGAQGDPGVGAPMEAAPPMEASAPIELNAPSEALHPTAQPAATPEQPAAAAAAPLSAPGAAADGPTTLRVDPPSRPRAMQKTPAQKQALEDAFKANPFPDETQKKALAQELDLTDNQVSTWFCHRRRKEKTSGAGVSPADSRPPKPAPTSIPAGAAPPVPASALAAVLEEDDDSDGHDDIDVAELPPQDQTRFAEYQQVVEAAKATLNVAYREDGPPLGLEFDDIVAPTTAGAGKAGAGRRRKAGEDDPDFQMGGGGKRPKSAPRSRPAAVLSPEELERLRQDEEARAALLTAKARQQVEKLEASIRREQDRLEREREKADMRLARERERELARLELERRKHLERMLKEQKKEEERRAKEEARLRALQEKEERRLALAREKELRAEERQRERNEKRKEREVLKALTQQERQALRLRSREPLAGPKDDVDFEWEALAVQYRKATGLPADIPVPPEGSDPPEGYPPLPTRPQFPPSTVQLLPVIDSDKIDNAAVGSLLSAWSSLSAFSHILAVEPLTVDDLLAALAQGIASKALADVHIALLRLLQADAEEAFAAGEGSGAAAEARYEGKGAEVHVVAPGARMLEEAWAWGFDVDAWRAHLTQATWPEIAREMAIAAGLGRKRPQRRREDKQRMGQEGEDVVVGGAQDKLELKLPARLARGTVKGAAWLVLKDAGYDGLHVEQIAKRIQHKGLRDLRTSKTPEASVAGALARDVLFERVAPATFALQSIRAHYRRLNMKGGKKSDGDGEGEGGSKAEPAGDEDGEKAAEENERGEGEDNENEEVDEEEEDEDEEEDENEEEEEERRRKDEAHAGEPWVAALRDADYDSLPLDLRISMLCALCQLAMDSPTVRETLERRLDELQRIKRATWEESKAEATLQRQRRHAEQAAKLRAQAEEAHKHLERLKAMANGETLPPGSEEKPKEEPKEEVKPEPMDVDGQAGVSAAAARAVPSAAELAIAAAEDGGNEDREAAQKRAQARAESTLREMEANAVRAEPLGTDRRYNRYWRFVRGDGDLLAGDACAGRVFVESDADGTLRMLCSVESLEALMASLDRQGPREQALYASLMRHRASLSGTMPSRPLDMPAPAAPLPLEAAASMWTLAAPSAASAGALEPFLPGEAAVVTKLKADMLAVHGALGDDDVDAEFDADDWKHSVRDAGDVAALRLALGKLEAAILPDALHPRFVKEPLLVRGAWIPSSGEVATALPGSTAADVLLSPLPPPAQAAEDNGDGTPGTADGEPAPPEPLVWLPPTVSAVAMRLCALDSALKYDAGAPAREAMDGYRFILRPGKLADAKNGLVRGMPIDHMGLVTPVIFPPFPHRLLFSPRIDFTFPVAQFQSDVATNSDALIAPSTTGRAKAVHAGSRIGSRGRPKGSKNKAKGGGAPGSGAAGKAPGKKRTPGGGMGQRSALNRELGGRSDSDQHYGSDLDDGDEEDEAFLGELVPHMAPQFNHNNSVAPSAGPSTAPSTAGDDEDEEISEDDGAQGGAESEGDAA